MTVVISPRICIFRISDNPRSFQKNTNVMKRTSPNESNVKTDRYVVSNQFSVNKQINNRVRKSSSSFLKPNIFLLFSHFRVLFHRFTDIVLVNSGERKLKKRKESSSWPMVFAEALGLTSDHQTNRPF